MAFQPTGPGRLNLRVREKASAWRFLKPKEAQGVEHKQQVVCVCVEEEVLRGTKADRAQGQGELCSDLQGLSPLRTW